MHYTSLNNGLGEHGVDGVREALQAIDDRDQDIGDAAVLELVHDAHPELCAFGLLDPDPEDFLGPVGQYAACDISGFVADEAFVADFDSDRLAAQDRKSVVVGKSVFLRLDLGCRRIIIKLTTTT